MDDPAASPWPERDRTQHLLLAAGAVFLLPVALGFSGVVALGGTALVVSATVASALLIYGLLGKAGTWFDEEGDAAGHGDAGEDVAGGDEGDGSGDDGDEPGA